MAAMDRGMGSPHLDGGRAKGGVFPKAPNRGGMPPARQWHADPAQRPRMRSLCELSVVNPFKLTRRQKELLREFEAKARRAPNLNKAFLHA